MAKYWTPEECEELRRTYIILSSRQLADKFKTNQASVRSVRRRLGLKLPPEIKLDRLVNAAYGTMEKRYKKRVNPFPGASIHVITYFGLIKKQEGLKTQIRGKADLSEIVRDIADCMNIRVEDIRGDKKMQALVNARQIFCWVTKIVRPEIPHNELACFLGYTSHSSVTTSINKIKGYFKVHDPKFMDVWYSYRANTKIYTKTKYKDHAF